MYNPKVSIIINCYNGDKFLNEAINSVLNQTYSNWEIIFWDNLSVDNSKEIFLSFKDERLKYFIADQHTTLYEARNLALEKISGELIAFLDCDDYWTKNKLELQVPCFINKKVGFSCGKYELLNERKKITKRKIDTATLKSGNITEELLENYFVLVSSLVVRKEALNDLDFIFDNRFTIIGDFDLVFRLSLISEMASINRKIATYRWHSSNTGLNANYKTSDELNIWVEENHKQLALIRKKSRDKFYKKVQSYNLVKYAYRGNRIKLLKILTSLDFLQTIKALSAIVLPNFIVKMWLDRDS